MQHQAFDSEPFRHWVLDGEINGELVGMVADNVPVPTWPRWVNYDGSNEVGKRTTRDIHLLSPSTMELFAYLSSQEWLSRLTSITGIDGLIPDSVLHGGGLHSTGRGGWLGVHLDYAKHPRLKLERRINLILFLNRTWYPHWGGHLEFWDSDAAKCVKRIVPSFNRLVLWEPSDVSYHGHPTPLNCPVNVPRNTIALTYLCEPRGEITRTRALFVPVR